MSRRSPRRDPGGRPDRPPARSATRARASSAPDRASSCGPAPAHEVASGIPAHSGRRWVTSPRLKSAAEISSSVSDEMPSAVIDSTWENARSHVATPCSKNQRNSADVRRSVAGRPSAFPRTTTCSPRAAASSLRQMTTSRAAGSKDRPTACRCGPRSVASRPPAGERCVSRSSSVVAARRLGPGACPRPAAVDDACSSSSGRSSSRPRAAAMASRATVSRYRAQARSIVSAARMSSPWLQGCQRPKVGLSSDSACAAWSHSGWPS